RPERFLAAHRAPSGAPVLAYDELVVGEALRPGVALAVGGEDDAHARAAGDGALDQAAGADGVVVGMRGHDQRPREGRCVSHQKSRSWRRNGERPRLIAGAHTTASRSPLFTPSKRCGPAASAAGPLTTPLRE